MAKTASRTNPDVLTAVVRGLMRGRGRLTVEASFAARLPRDLQHARTRLGDFDEGSRFKRLASYDVLYEMGVVLSDSRRPLSMGEVSSALAVPVSTATRIVDWQVRYGYVERLSDPHDRRRVLVALTDSGRALLSSVDKFLVGRLERGVRRFSPAERRQLAALLQKLIEGLAEGDA